jgi:outer membrane protein TolC
MMLVPSILFIILVTAGCKAMPSRHPEDAGAAIPDRWSAIKESNGPTPERWVESFGDANLSTLIQRALSDNYELKSAAARVNAALAQARIDGSGRLPQLFFSPDYQQAQIRDAGFGSARFSAFEALFGLSWELDVWGGMRDFHEAAIHEATATSVDFRGARLSLAARVAQSYFELAETRLQAEVAAQSIKDRRTLAAEEWLRQQEEALREAVEQTEASQKLAVYSYRNGLIEILTLLDSYRSTLNAQSAHLLVKRQLLSNRINLFLALGGDI